MVLIDFDFFFIYVDIVVVLFVKIGVLEWVMLVLGYKKVLSSGIFIMNKIFGLLCYVV